VVGKVNCVNGRIFSQITVTITDAGGNEVASQQVGSDGLYMFTLANAGTYTATLGNLPSGISSVSYSVNLGPYVPGSSVTGDLAPDSTTELDWLVDGTACNSPGTGTPGYWGKYSRTWPVSTITVGGIVYTKNQAIAIIQMSVSGDKRWTLFPSLVSAKLNVIIGNEASCIQDTIDQADAWWAAYHGSPVAGSSAAWAVGGPLNTTLDAYNNGLLCAPHRN
jgi:hypothetical protein